MYTNHRDTLVQCTAGWYCCPERPLFSTGAKQGVGWLLRIAAGQGLPFVQGGDQKYFSVASTKHVVILSMFVTSLLSLKKLIFIVDYNDDVLVYTQSLMQCFRAAIHR